MANAKDKPSKKAANQVFTDKHGGRGWWAQGVWVTVWKPGMWLAISQEEQNEHREHRKHHGNWPEHTHKYLHCKQGKRLRMLKRFQQFYVFECFFSFSERGNV